MIQKKSFRAVAPPVSDVVRFSLPRLRTVQLPGPLRLHVYDRCDTPVCYLSALCPGGASEAQSPAQAWLAASTMREGCRDMDGDTIDSILDYNGAWIKSANTSHHIQTSLFSLNARLPQVLPVFMDILAHPTYPPQRIAVRREALARNIEVSQTEVSYMAQCAVDKMIMGPAHPEARIDTPHSVMQLDSDMLSAFAPSQITPSTEFFLCGQITPQIERMVSEAILNAARQDMPPAPALNLQPYSPMPAARQHIHMPRTQQSAVMMALPAIPRNHPDYIPLHLAVTALGGYFGSRLMLEIRERKGLTYGISAALNGSLDGAHILISAQTANDSVDLLIRDVAAEMKRLASDPPQGEELRRLRQSAVSAQASTLDSPFSIVNFYIMERTVGLTPGYFAAKQQAISQLSPDMIAEMAARYLDPTRLRIAIAGTAPSS